ncbi:cardiolipin synthase [Fusobacterium perfoetens]|uniref:cardiolipin synthase n=1 Tax=Fusobacterium perfoetens TaxID=852 RepID=UPI001F48AA0C|nr:cardiolipin synthase [Fusobacterium perfoetens]MCF2624701.1 cardiolipin synthase [Fusobacterium perfoetens]
MLQQVFHLLGDYIFVANIFLASVVLFFERKRPVYTLFWITILLLTSYFGFIAYLFFGMKFYKKRNTEKFYTRNFLRQIYKENHYKVQLVEKRTKLVSYIVKSVGNKVTYLNNVYFFKEGNSFFQRMIEDIRNAKETINMEYYIFSDDEFGSGIYDELILKAQEGVKIKIIIDGIGTKILKRKRIKQLEKAGIKVKTFFPSHFPFFRFGNLRANYRDHRKMCIIDSLILYTGGFNIGNEYIGKGKLGNWRDTGARINGEIAVDADREFYISWNFVHKGVNLRDIDKQLRSKVNNIEERKEKFHINAMQIVSSGPNYQTRTIRDCFMNLIMSAKRSIYIETPYFVPDDLLLDCLRIAIMSGVEVKIIVPYIGDHPFVYWANQGFIVELLEMGAEVYRYTDGFFHSKLIIIDNEVASFGSANFDYRSLYQNFEINFNVYDLELVGHLRQIFFEDISKSVSLDYKVMKERNVSEKIKESICRLISPVI